MSRVIGNTSVLGVFETQTIVSNDVDNEFPLLYSVGSAASLDVIYDGQFLQPNVDFSLGNSGTSIVFGFVPSSAVTLFIKYGGRELLVPSNPGARPLRDHFVGDNVTVTFALSPVQPLFEEALIVFIDGVQQRFTEHWTLDSNTNEITFLTAPATSADIDVHILGLERNDLVSVDPGTITTDKIADGAVTNSKLNITLSPYNINGLGGLVTFGGMSIDTSDIQEAEYADCGEIVRVRILFTATFSGSPDNKIRVPMPIPIDSVNVAGSVNLITASSLEMGIIRWGGAQSIDIYRNLGVNFSLEEWTAEIVLEYKAA